MMRTATLVMVVLAIAASEVAADKLEMPALPPRADSIVHEKDPVAEALLADEENRHQDPTLNMLQDAMAQKKEFMPAFKKKALDAMDAEIKKHKEQEKQMQKQIMKKIKHRANKEKLRFAGVDRFNALRQKYPSFKTPEVQAQAQAEPTIIFHGPTRSAAAMNAAPAHKTVVGKPATKAPAHKTVVDKPATKALAHKTVVDKPATKALAHKTVVGKPATKTQTSHNIATATWAQLDADAAAAHVMKEKKEMIKQIVTATGAQAAMVETGIKVKNVRHTEESPHHLAPVHYSPVPEGDDARKANADLASGADAARDEDWQVHKATYETLHPSALEVNKAKEQKKEEKASPKPLKVAQKSFHHGLDTIQATKEIVRMPLTKLTLEEAKSQCAKVRSTADGKCKDDKHDTHNFCLTEGTEKTECDKHKMKDAAECNVSHETAMNKCYDLWNRAKVNIAEARKKAAAPMDHTDTQVSGMAAGSTKCAELMTKAQASCASAETTYKSECKSTMMEAIDMSVLQLKLGDEPSAGDKAASADASDSAEALKKAEETLTKQDASPELKDAIAKCDLKKNEYKRSCISAVHEARDTCDSLTSASADDNTPTA